MREQTLNYIQTFLGEFDGFFHSEEEVQLLLVKYLINSNYFDNVFVEYYVHTHLIPNYPWQNDKKISVDIVVEKNNLYLPIEIKYKTKRQLFPHFIFGSLTNVELAEQGAQNEGCYSFWKDIKRIETINSTFHNTEIGLVLFITNDSSYERLPRQGVQYGPFSIHQNRQVPAETFLNWDATIKPIKPDRAVKFPGFHIDKNYLINWQDLNIEEHKYILI